MVNGHKKILTGQAFHVDGLRTCDGRALGDMQRAMGIVLSSGENRSLDGRQKTLFGLGVKKLHLDWAPKSRTSC